MNIEEKRREIDVIDANIADLLNRRAVISREISVLKMRAGLPIADEKREDEIIQGLIRKNRGCISDAAITSIYRAILDESRRLQAAVRAEVITNGVAR